MNSSLAAGALALKMLQDNNNGTDVKQDSDDNNLVMTKIGAILGIFVV